MDRFNLIAALLIVLFASLSLMASLLGSALVYASNGPPDSEVSISNGILTVYIESKTGYDGIGTYTICTGPNHPVPNQDILQFGVNGDA